MGYPRKMDIVLCIDVSGGMCDFVENFKAEISELHTYIKKYMEKDDIFTLEGLRVRVVAFSDYAADGDMAITQSQFFELPEENEYFTMFVQNIEQLAGGDDPEDGLEAFVTALQSDWSKDAMRRVVAVITDAPAHPLRRNEWCPGYPNDMPSDLKDLREQWNQHLPSRKKIVLMTPDVEPWSDICEHWYNAYLMNMSREDIRQLNIEKIAETIVACSRSG